WRLHGPGADQHAFQEAVRARLKVEAVLERAGFALVGVHRHQPWRRLLADEAPLATGREAGATQAAQPRVLQQADDLFRRALAGKTLLGQGVAAALHIVLDALVRRYLRCRAALRDGREGLHRRGIVDEV